MKSSINQREVDIIQKVMQTEEQKGTFYKPKWELRPKIQPHPTRRWCHTSTLHGQNIYIMGGRLPQSAKVRDYSFKLNCETFASEPIQLSDNLMMRESHSCSLANDSMYVMFGISKSSKVLKDCMQFRITPGGLVGQKKQQVPEIQARESHMSVVLDERYVLIYGGSDSEEKFIKDFYLYDVEKETWKKVEKVEGEIQAKVGGTLINIKNHIYQFGGQINDENQYSNQIYKIQISNYRSTGDQVSDPQILITKVPVTGNKPMPRSQFASVVFKDRYLLVVGGQGPLKEKAQFPTLLSDVWAFDIEKMQWEEIVPENAQIFKPRSSFTANIYKDNLIVFGGLVGFKDWRSSDQIFVLNLCNQVQKRPICGLCKASYKMVPKQEIQVEKTKAITNKIHFKTGISMIFNISRMIQDPLVSIGTLLHSLDYFRPEKCSVVLKPQRLCLTMKSLPITQEQFYQLITQYEFVPLIQQGDSRIMKALSGQIRNNRLKYLSYCLKTVGFRLGNELFVSFISQQNEVQMCLMNKFGIYCSQTNLAVEDEAKNNDADVILQYLKQNRIDLKELFEGKMIICVTGLRSNKDESGRYTRELKFDGQKKDVICKGKTLKQYLNVAFVDKVQWKVSISDEFLPFASEDEFHEVKQNQVDRWIQKNRYPQLFGGIYTFESQEPTIFVYQCGKLVHQKKLKQQSEINQSTSFEFHITSSILADITFTTVLPTQQLLSAIKQIIRQINSPQIELKRDRSLTRQDQEQIIVNHNAQKMIAQKEQRNGIRNVTEEQNIMNSKLPKKSVKMNGTQIADSNQLTIKSEASQHKKRVGKDDEINN